MQFAGEFSNRLIIIGAAEVVAAVGADELTVMAGEAMAASGADLGVVRRGVRLLGGANRTTL